MEPSNERTHVHRVSITVEGEACEFEDPCIRVDEASRMVDIWAAANDAEPTLRAPLQETTIEWRGYELDGTTAPRSHH